MCERLHVLPSPGGLMDQDSFFVHGMDIVLTCRDAKEALDRAEAQKPRPGQMPRR